MENIFSLLEFEKHPVSKAVEKYQGIIEEMNIKSGFEKIAKISFPNGLTASVITGELIEPYFCEIAVILTETDKIIKIAKMNTEKEANSFLNAIKKY